MTKQSSDPDIAGACPECHVGGARHSLGGICAGCSNWNEELKEKQDRQAARMAVISEIRDDRFIDKDKLADLLEDICDKLWGGEL